MKELIPHEILYDYDGPRIFTMLDENGDLKLAYWLVEFQGLARFLVVPTTDQIITDLKTGQVTVYEALNQQGCLLCDLLPSGEIKSCESIMFHSISSHFLPKQGVLLYSRSQDH